MFLNIFSLSTLKMAVVFKVRRITWSIMWYISVNKSLESKPMATLVDRCPEYLQTASSAEDVPSEH